MKPIKVAVIGVGNCASSLVQGVAYYRSNNSSQGLIHDRIGGYGAGDVEFVLGVDVDARKVGKDISEAIFSAPNNTAVFMPNVPATGTKVIMGRVSDGVAAHMTSVGEKGFIVADEAEATQESIVKALKDSGAEILLNFLPVGSQEATEFYMECALEAGVAVVNCMPVFIASRPEWERRFAEKRMRECCRSLLVEKRRGMGGASVHPGKGKEVTPWCNTRTSTWKRSISTKRWGE